MISGHSSISSNFFSFLTRNVLFHPLPGGVRYQDKRAPVMDINEPFISCGRDHVTATFYSANVCPWQTADDMNL